MEATPQAGRKSKGLSGVNSGFIISSQSEIDAGCYAARLDLCPFCSLSPERVFLESEHAIAFADAFPVSEGHTLVAPRKHVASIYQLPITAQRALWDLVGKVRERLLKDFKPDGFNIGFNDGAAAGQTVDHAHIHIILRRQGDVPDPRGGIRWVVAENAPYWKK